MAMALAIAFAFAFAMAFAMAFAVAFAMATAVALERVVMLSGEAAKHHATWVCSLGISECAAVLAPIKAEPPALPAVLRLAARGSQP